MTQFLLPNGELEFVVDNLSGSLGAGASGEHHDLGSAIGVRGFQKSDGNGHGDPSRSKRTLSSRNRPRVALELTQQVGEAHVATLNGLKKSKKTKTIRIHDHNMSSMYFLISSA